MNQENETRPATVSFSRAKQVAGVKPAPAPETSTAVVPANTNTAVGSVDPGGCLVGEFDSSILRKPPVIALVSGNSAVSLENPEWLGQFVWDKAVALGKEAVIIPTRLTNSFKEDRPFADKNPTPPAFFKGLAEAKASGLKYMAVAVIEMLVELTPEQAKLGPLEAHKVNLAGKEYLPATLWVQKTSYDCARTLVADLKHWLADRLANGQYKLTTRVCPGPSGPYRSPILKAHGKTPQDVSEAIHAEFSI